MKNDNIVGFSRASRFRGNEWQAFDNLPQPLRWALHEAVVDWCSLQTRWALNRLVKMGAPPDEAIAAMVKVGLDDDRREIIEFGRALPRVFGGASPHMRANATVQPYGDRCPTAQRPQRRRRRWA